MKFIFDEVSYMYEEKKGSVIKEAFQKWSGLFLVIVAAFAVVFVVTNAGAIFGFIFRFFRILKPVVYGCIIAYLLNPLMKMYQDLFLSLIERKGKEATQRQKGMTRGGAIALALLSGILIILVLCWMIIPQILESLTSLAGTLPDKVTYYYDLINEKIRSNQALQGRFEEAALNITQYIENMIFTEFMPWLKTELLPGVNMVAVEFANGVMGFLNVLYNLFIGIIVAIYILAGKENFTAQAKKFTYGVMKKDFADVVIHYVRLTNEMFSGFIVGKILDSTIIGIICFIGMTVFSMPYALLISVIVGVTNLIPVFGPYIGLIPSVFLILLVSPIQALYFVIFIAILQQIDGNLIGPAILGESTGLSAFWVLFSILLFGGVWGIVGMLIGVPLFAVIYRIIKDFIEWRLHGKHLQEETSQYKNLKAVELSGDGADYVYFTAQELSDKKEKKKIRRNEIKENMASALSTVKKKRSPDRKPEENDAQQRSAEASGKEEQAKKK